MTFLFSLNSIGENSHVAMPGWRGVCERWLPTRKLVCSHQSLWIVGKPTISAAFFLLIIVLQILRGLPWWVSGRVHLQCRRRRRCGFNPWVRKIPWSRKWQPTAVFLLGKSPAQRSLAGYSPWGPKESDVTEQACIADCKVLWALFLQPAGLHWISRGGKCPLRSWPRICGARNPPNTSEHWHLASVQTMVFLINHYLFHEQKPEAHLHKHKETQQFPWQLSIRVDQWERISRFGGRIMSNTNSRIMCHRCRKIGGSEWSVLFRLVIQVLPLETVLMGLFYPKTIKKQDSPGLPWWSSG